jgi:hypothetical protein
MVCILYHYQNVFQNRRKNNAFIFIVYLIKYMDESIIFIILQICREIGVDGDIIQKCLSSFKTSIYQYEKILQYAPKYNLYVKRMSDLPSYTYNERLNIAYNIYNHMIPELYDFALSVIESIMDLSQRSLIQRF